MSALSIQPTFPIFTETDGQPLENGYIWIGTVNLDPQVNPINVYFDAALTILAAQPIRTINGYPSRNGTPARLYVNSDYSIRVMNRNGSAVYSAPAATERYSSVVIGTISGTDVSFIQSGAGAVTRTMQAKAQEWFSPFDYGAVGNSDAGGAVGANDTGAFTLLEAEQSGGVVNLDNKFYLVSSPVPTKNNYINGKFVLSNGSTYDQPNNFSIGHEALFSNTFVPNAWPAGGGISYASGNYNTAVGDSALRANTTGRRNTAVGTYAMYSNVGGYYNCAFGSLALYTNTSGNYNNAFGNQSLQFNTVGNNNCAFGMGAMTANVDGSDNVAVGYLALQITTSPDRVVAIGTQAAYRYEGADTVAIGHQALSNAGANGLYNVAIGSASMGLMTTGGSNIAIGRRALAAQTTASNNVAIGTDAMVSSGNGDQNVAIGGSAMANTTTAFQNVGIGYAAGNALTDGSNNVFIGRFAAQLTTTGDGCVAIGEQAMASNVDGDRNTCVGQGADTGGASFSNTTAIGYGATGTASNQVQLGNSSVSSLRCQVSLTVVSDERDKVKTAEMPGLAFVKELDTFVGRWNKRDGSENPEGTFAFLSAQNLQSTQSKFNVDLGLVDSTNPEQLAATYERLIPSLVKAIQELNAEVEALKDAR